jgi:hypothetical protein
VPLPDELVPDTVDLGGRPRADDDPGTCCCQGPGGGRTDPATPSGDYGCTVFE